MKDHYRKINTLDDALDAVLMKLDSMDKLPVDKLIIQHRDFEIAISQKSGTTELPRKPKQLRGDSRT